MSQSIKISSKIRLRDFNPGFHASLDKDKTREKTIQLATRIGELQQLLYANQSHALVILFQGMDTSGKDGAGKRVLQFVPPSGVETANFKAPSSEELAHDFLWRAHKAVPRYGNIGIFNRSHYEDVLIVRVMNLQPKPIWATRYAQINAFEKILTENKIVLLKFYLHISKAEQAQRLQSRVDDPKKHWKLETSDFKARTHWRHYEAAYEDAINLCNTSYAPWHVVPANHKWYRDYVVAQTVVKALEKLKMKWPKAANGFSHLKVK